MNLFKISFLAKQIKTGERFARRSCQEFSVSQEGGDIAAVAMHGVGQYVYGIYSVDYDIRFFKYVIMESTVCRATTG